MHENTHKQGLAAQATAKKKKRRIYTLSVSGTTWRRQGRILHMCDEPPTLSTFATPYFSFCHENYPSVQQWLLTVIRSGLGELLL